MIAEQIGDEAVRHEQQTKALLAGIKRQVRALERHLGLAPHETPVPRHRGHRVGIDVRPGSVKQARTEARLSMEELAGGQLTRAAICLIEKGRCRPSLQTLDLIVAATGRPLEFFIADTPWNQFVFGQKAS